MLNFHLSCSKEGEIKGCVPRIHTAQDQIPVFLLKGYVSAGKILNLAMTQFSPCRMGTIIEPVS